MAELHDARPKPFTVWPLVVNGKVVIDGVVNGGSYIELRAAFFDRALAKNLGHLLMESGKFHIFNSEVKIGETAVQEFHVVTRSTPAFKVEFLSPTRFETPPYVKRPAPVYDLTPRPLNLFKSAVKTAMRLGLVDARWARRFLRLAYASVGVADFGCRGRCVVSVRLSGDRRLRGFVGWALYRAFETSMVGDMWRMLSVAEAFGVGSNRPLGFGGRQSHASAVGRGCSVERYSLLVVSRSAVFDYYDEAGLGVELIRGTAAGGKKSTVARRRRSRKVACPVAPRNTGLGQRSTVGIKSWPSRCGAN